MSEQVRYTIECLPEEIPIRGNCMVSGDDAFDEQCAREIEHELACGNPWAWCSVRVSARAGGVTGDAYLGGCSYKSEDDFKREGMYYDSMCAEALADLKAKVDEQARAALHRATQGGDK